MPSGLRHKTPEQLRAEIVYQEQMVSSHDDSIKNMEEVLENARALVDATNASLSRQRMTRNNHQQRLVWARNYLLMKRPL